MPGSAGGSEGSPQAEAEACERIPTSSNLERWIRRTGAPASPSQPPPSGAKPAAPSAALRSTDAFAPTDGAAPTDGGAPTDGAAPTDGGAPTDAFNRAASVCSRSRWPSSTLLTVAVRARSWYEAGWAGSEIPAPTTLTRAPGSTAATAIGSGSMHSSLGSHDWTTRSTARFQP